MIRTGLALALALAAAAPAAQNSTRKIRPQPGPMAERIGSAVPWRRDLDDALAEAAKTGRPVFWYVPTVPGSPMDRKPEIDRYLRAGPFSWPWLIGVLERNFVPVDVVPSRAQAKAHGLVRQRFIEPGFVVLGADGGELARSDGITTLAPAWWRARLAPVAGSPLPAPGALEAAFAAGDLDVVVERAGAAIAGDDAAAAAEARFWLGLAHLRRRRFDALRAEWEQLMQRHADHPLAWKVAAELEGHGPLLRGLEVFDAVPEAALAQATGSTLAPPGAYAVDELITRSLRFLCRQQDEDGLWRDSTYDFGGTDSLPNVHAAISALCGTALLAWRERHPEAVDAALRRLVPRLFAADAIAPEDRDEIVWAHAYRLRLLCALHRAESPLVDDFAASAGALIAALAALQQESGAWFHEYANPFVMATVLLALRDAEATGCAVPSLPVSRGVGALARCRADSGGFPYGFSPDPRRVDVAGAAGRMPLCELALFQWGESTPQRLHDALAAAFEHHDLMAAVRRYDDHADRHGYGGFFFWYDLRARSEAIAALPQDHEQRAALLARQRAQVLALPEVDGCFVDSHELGRCYGTAMALLCLSLTAP